MKKRIIIALCSLIAIFSALSLSGCATRPFKVDWFIYSYEIDGEVYEVGFDYFDHFNPVYPNAGIYFDRDGNFSFTDKDGSEYYGSYKRRNTLKDTKITLSFADGGKANGKCSCVKRHGDNYYYAEFEINGVKYNFRDRRRVFFEDNLYYYLKSVSNAVITFANTGERTWPYYDEALTNAVMGKVGDSFFAVTDGCLYMLDDYSFWCYDVDGEGIKTSEPKEGDCILRISCNRLAIYYV